MMNQQRMPGNRRLKQRGSVTIMVAVSLVAFLSFAILAIDGGIMMAAKTQLQNAADAAALAGASAILQGGATDQARQRARDFSSFNYAVQDTLRPVLITDEDITFPDASHIRVRTHRTVATGDPLRTYFRRVVDAALLNVADVTATAIAGCWDVCAARCVRPWSIPDRWTDTNGNQRWDAGEPYDPVATGYAAPGDVGLEIVLKLGDPQSAFEPGIYYPVCFPPLGGPTSPETGAAIYRQWIAGCEPWPIGVGDSLLVQPGRMTGPSRQGVQDLIAQDPGARWDSGTRTVVGSAFATSPRVVAIPMFDPRLPPSQGRTVVHVVKLSGFFIEGVQGNSTVTGRFIQSTMPGESCGGFTPGSLAHGMGLTG